MNNFRDYYEILGIVPEADAQLIKRTYRQLARQYHPDLNPGNQAAEERFKQLNEAYEMLSDPEHRRQYDEYRRYWLAQKNAAEFRDLEDFDCFVDQLLNRHEQPTKPQRVRSPQPELKRSRASRDTEAELQVPLERAYRGGYERVRLEDGRALEVAMPAGMATGKRIRLRGQGIDGGDLYLRILVEPHPFFTLQEQDVFCRLPITPSEAALGGQVAVPTLDGPVNMTLPAGAQAGSRLRLGGKGYGSPTGQRGDQIVELVIAVPTRLSEQETRLYQRLQAAETNPRAELF